MVSCVFANPHICNVWCTRDMVLSAPDSWNIYELTGTDWLWKCLKTTNLYICWLLKPKLTQQCLTSKATQYSNHLWILIMGWLVISCLLCVAAVH